MTYDLTGEDPSDKNKGKRVTPHHLSDGFRMQSWLAQPRLMAESNLG